MARMMWRMMGERKGGAMPVTRLDRTCTGFANALSYQGACHMAAYRRGDVDYIRVTLEPHKGFGVHAMLYDGPIGGTWAMQGREA